MPWARRYELLALTPNVTTGTYQINDVDLGPYAIFYITLKYGRHSCSISETLLRYGEYSQP